MADVPGNEIDGYLDALEEPKRSTLARLRDTIMAIVPDAEQTISYGMPAFRLRGKVVAGFAAFKNHLSYLPHSGSVIPQLGKELEIFESEQAAQSCYFKNAFVPMRSEISSWLLIRSSHVRQ
jgi:uncharacterized protein YdhG (YjbR/CyaY superfamily)